jgi:putative FmdB family regulatory protein
MPTYDYVCDACDHAFEQWQSFHDAHLTTCPECKKKKLRRLIGTGAAIVFKGSGFYETDYNRGSDYQEKAKADTEAAKPAEAKPADAPSPPAATTDPTPPADTGKKSGGGGKGKKGGK